MKNAVQTLDGYLMLYPKYRVVFLDKALNDSAQLPKYTANTKHWIVGS